jgi:hypothetical protein
MSAAVHWRLEIEQDYLRAELISRETAQQTREFLHAVAAAAAAHALRRVLISVKSSKPLFKVDEYSIDEFLALLAREPEGRVALLADSGEVRRSHEYIEVLARQCGAQARSFPSEAAALEWLRRA